MLFQVSSQMGSIAPLQKLQKKSVHALKRALSESHIADLRMGNLCSMGASAAAKKVKSNQKILCNVLNHQSYSVRLKMIWALDEV